jgi:hypothetical protein
LPQRHLFEAVNAHFGNIDLPAVMQPAAATPTSMTAHSDLMTAIIRKQ